MARTAVVAAPGSPTPWLTTAACAVVIGVTCDFIRGEVLDGRLRGYVIRRPGKRTIYRVRAADFSIYLTKHWTRAGQ